MAERAATVHFEWQCLNFAPIEERVRDMAKGMGLACRVEVRRYFLVQRGYLLVNGPAGKCEEFMAGVEEATNEYSTPWLDLAGYPQ